jgi:hypothetical protein
MSQHLLVIAEITTAHYLASIQELHPLSSIILTYVTPSNLNHLLLDPSGEATTNDKLSQCLKSLEAFEHALSSLAHIRVT